jgi:hypothetical protein
MNLILRREAPVLPRVQPADVQTTHSNDLELPTHHYWWVKGTYYRCLLRDEAQVEVWHQIGLFVGEWQPMQAVVALKQSLLRAA